MSLKTKIKNLLMRTPAYKKLQEMENFNRTLAAENSALQKQMDRLESTLAACCSEFEKIHELIAMHNRETGERLDMQTQHFNELIAMHNRETGERLDMQTRDLSSAITKLADTLSGHKEYLLRDNILLRWQILDALDEVLYPPETPVTCPICGSSAPKSSLGTKISACIYNGGKLERFECPRCGTVFGPLKMLVMDQEQIAAEYTQCYKCYHESDATEILECSAFNDLAPVKDGIYLNYGAGAWNKTSEHLREEGYTVYDYEPYAPAADSPWLLRTEEELEKFKFDGIFSNDLIEHLRDPVASLRKMAGLLKDGGSMVHGSGCYEYAFEYTRFHLTFFTGRSLEFLGRALDMDIELGERTAPASPFRKCKFTSKA